MESIGSIISCACCILSGRITGAPRRRRDLNDGCRVIVFIPVSPTIRPAKRAAAAAASAIIQQWGTDRLSVVVATTDICSPLASATTAYLGLVETSILITSDSISSSRLLVRRRKPSSLLRARRTPARLLMCDDDDCSFRYHCCWSCNQSCCSGLAAAHQAPSRFCCSKYDRVVLTGEGRSRCHLAGMGGVAVCFPIHDDAMRRGFLHFKM